MMPLDAPAMPSPPKARRGRPPGKKSRIAAQSLRLHHFAFLRAMLEGLEIRWAWERYMAFEGGPDDVRHFDARHRDLVRLVRIAADERGLSQSVDIAFGTAADPAPAPEPPPLPSLDDFISLKCEEEGWDVDFYSQAEWMGLYQEEYQLDGKGQPLQRPATAADAPSSDRSNGRPTLAHRLAALNDLAGQLSRPPTLEDSLASWLAPGLSNQLLGTQVDGRPLPLVTIANLIAFINLYQHRWWTRVPRLGKERADRLVQWLQPLAELLKQPLKEQALVPFQQRALTAQRAGTALVAQGGKTYGLVPITDLAVPPDLSGARGKFRADGPNTWGVRDDLEAIMEWLSRHKGTPRTFASYGRIAERFYLWCVLVRRLPLSSLHTKDFEAYDLFMQRPPADWVQPLVAMRGTRDWRPFKGPLSASSRKLNFTVIGSMLNAMVEVGYLKANAANGVAKSLKLPRSKIHAHRSFDEAQWQWFMTCWAKQYREVGPAVPPGVEQPFSPTALAKDVSPSRAAELRRMRLVLELAATTGLRRIELVTTRRRQLQRVLVDGEHVWILSVLGKGSKEREVVVYDDVKDMIDQHHKDMLSNGTAFDKENHRHRTLDNPHSDQVQAPLPEVDEGDGALPSPANPPKPDELDPGELPIVGALRKPPRRWKLDPVTGVRVLDADSKNADMHGSLDPTALYQSLKRFFQRCGEQAAAQGLGIDTASLSRASTHWLRHFFANSAAADDVSGPALMSAMGHASLQTTSVYLNPERKTLVRELSRMRRR